MGSSPGGALILVELSSLENSHPTVERSSILEGLPFWRGLHPGGVSLLGGGSLSGRTPIHEGSSILEGLISWMVFHLGVALFLEGAPFLERLLSWNSSYPGVVSHPRKLLSWMGLPSKRSLPSWKDSLPGRGSRPGTTLSWRSLPTWRGLPPYRRFPSWSSLVFCMDSHSDRSSQPGRTPILEGALALEGVPSWSLSERTLIFGGLRSWEGSQPGVTPIL
jgi:hypothetical protein